MPKLTVVDTREFTVSQFVKEHTEGFAQVLGIFPRSAARKIRRFTRALFGSLRIGETMRFPVPGTEPRCLVEWKKTGRDTFAVSRLQEASSKRRTRR